MKPYVMILCGGVGSRLWPISRQHLPKQFLELWGEQSLFEMTLQRALQMTIPERIWVLTTEALKPLVYERTKLFSIQILCEPYSKNTGSAITYAMAQMPFDEIPCVIMPSDHWIDHEPFLRQIQDALIAGQHHLSLFGIKPQFPATNFGYIQRQLNEPTIFSPVQSFLEKPSLERAQNLIKRNDIYWNSGIFIWTKKIFFQELLKIHQSIAKNLNDVMRQGKNWLSFFDDLPSLSIDHLLLEKSDNVVCAEAQFNWKDLGTWQSVQEFLIETNQIRLNDDTMIAQIDCQNCLIINQNTQQKVFTLGLQNQIVIVTQDSVVCLPLSESNRIQEIVAQVKKDGAVELL